jgi:hypothetical protein
MITTKKRRKHPAIPSKRTGNGRLNKVRRSFIIEMDALLSKDKKASSISRAGSVKNSFPSAGWAEGIVRPGPEKMGEGNVLTYITQRSPKSYIF